MAGPLGLLVGGTALLWPAACFRARSAPRSQPVLTSKPALIGYAAHAAVAGLYRLLLDVTGIDPVTIDEATSTFFVGLSRAAQRLVFTCTAAGARLGNIADLYRLLDEAGVPETRMY